MGSFGIGKHAHVEAGLFAVLLTLLTYGIKWICGMKFPHTILGLPAFIGIFLGFYVIFFIALLIAWNRR